MSELVPLSMKLAASVVGQQVSLPISFKALAIAQAGEPVGVQRKSIVSLQDDEVLIRVSYVFDQQDGSRPRPRKRLQLSLSVRTRGCY